MKVCSHCKACLEDDASQCPMDGNPLFHPFSGTRLIDEKYLIARCLGQGAMGAVYLARHRGLDKDFALKLIDVQSPDRREFAQRFSIEAKALGKLRHPNIVDVTDYGVDPREEGLPYLVMEYLTGHTLRQKLTELSKMSFSEKLWILEQAAEGIDYAHKNGVLHCDLKPGNIFLGKNDQKGGIQVKILDFGFAKLLHQSVRQGRVHDSQADTADAPAIGFKRVVADETQLSEFETIPDSPIGVVGTPAYMAPEVILHQETSPLSDLYSFGIVVYELIAGRPPFSGKIKDVILSQISIQPPKPGEFCKGIAPEVEAAILIPLDKVPKQRPDSARDIVRMIRSADLNYQRRKFRTFEIPRRAAIAAILTPLMVVLWILVSLSDIVSGLENKTIDARVALSEDRLPDPRVMIATFDDDSLENDRVPLANKAEEVAEVLQQVFAAGAAGVAIDFLLPYSWSSSQAFSRLVLENADHLTLAAFANPSGEMLGMECVTGLTAVALGSNRVKSLFGLVNLQEDGDGVVRRARIHYADIAGTKWDSWPAKAAGSLADPQKLIQNTDDSKDDFWIDFSADWKRIEHISWKDMEKLLNNNPAVFKHRLLLLGGDYIASGDDYHRVAAPSGFPGAVSGVILQALTINTILSGLPIRETGISYGLSLVAFLSIIVLFGTMCIRRISIAAFLCAGIILIYAIACLALFRWLKLIAPVCSPVTILILAFCMAMLLRKKLTSFPSAEVK